LTEAPAAETPKRKRRRRAAPAPAPEPPPPPAVEAPEPAAEPRSALDTVHAVFWRSGLLNVAAVTRRELAAYFVSPVGWVVACIFFLLVSVFGYLLSAVAAAQATMDGVFNVINNFLLLILVPLLTMRLFAEERSTGTLEVLLTAPLRDWEAVLGKWLGAFLFYLGLIVLTLAYVGLLAYYVPTKITFHLAGYSLRVGSLDYGLLASTYVGMVLVGAAATAIGLLCSTLTRSQIIAFFLGMGLITFVWYAGSGLSVLVAEPYARFFQYIGGFNRYQSFTLGQIHLRDVAYFLSLTVGALFLATRVLESRKWR